MGVQGERGEEVCAGEVCVWEERWCVCDECVGVCKDLLRHEVLYVIM